MGTNWTMPFYRSAAYKKKMSKSVEACRAKETPDERAERNHKIARSYRHTVGERKLAENKHAKPGVRMAIIKWMHARDDQ